MTHKGWLIFAIFTFLTLIAWATFDIIHSRAKIEVPVQQKEIIEPISPDFDIKALDTTP